MNAKTETPIFYAMREQALAGITASKRGKVQPREWIDSLLAAGRAINADYQYGCAEWELLYVAERIFGKLWHKAPSQVAAYRRSKLAADEQQVCLILRGWPVRHRWREHDLFGGPDAPPAKVAPSMGASSESIRQMAQAIAIGLQGAIAPSGKF